MPVRTERSRWWPSRASCSAIARTAPRIARVTLTRARSAALPALRSRPPRPTARASSAADEVQLLAQPRGALDVVEALGLVEVLAQLDDALAVGGLGLGVEHRARVAAVADGQLAGRGARGRAPDRRPRAAASTGPDTRSIAWISTSGCSSSVARYCRPLRSFRRTVSAPVTVQISPSSRNVAVGAPGAAPGRRLRGARGRAPLTAAASARPARPGSASPGSAARSAPSRSPSSPRGAPRQRRAAQPLRGGRRALQQRPAALAVLRAVAQQQQPRGRQLGPRDPDRRAQRGVQLGRAAQVLLGLGVTCRSPPRAAPRWWSTQPHALIPE